MPSSTEQVFHGPTTDVALLDATWQRLPEWADSSSWVTTHAPDLVSEGPPYPGLLVKANVPEGGEVRVRCNHEAPGAPFECVHRTELVVGDHGFVVETDSGFMPVPLPWATTTLTSGCIRSRRTSKRAP